MQLSADFCPSLQAALIFLLCQGIEFDVDYADALNAIIRLPFSIFEIVVSHLHKWQELSCLHKSEGPKVWDLAAVVFPLTLARRKDVAHLEDDEDKLALVKVPLARS